MRGRPQKTRKIKFFPEINYFKPAGIPLRSLETVVLALDEVEALRLAELVGLDQEQAAKKIKVSRITFQRILHRAHKKITDALIYGKAIKMEGGEITMPNLDGTGPVGQGPRTGRGRGIGKVSNVPGRRAGGSSDCECPKCGEKVLHTRGIPCSETKCPKCGTPMRGIFCR